MKGLHKTKYNFLLFYNLGHVNHFLVRIVLGSLLSHTI